MADTKVRHAAAQRLKVTGAPRSDDLARALLAAARLRLAERPVPSTRRQWARLLTLACRQFVARGFDEAEVWRRLGACPSNRVLLDGGAEA